MGRGELEFVHPTRPQRTRTDGAPELGRWLGDEVMGGPPAGCGDPVVWRVGHPPSF